jgi:tetratricopeptide (TPR) repeat protein
MGVCRYWLDDFEGAAFWLEQSLRITPPGGIGVPADAMANIYRLYKQHERALELHKLAVESDPNNAAFMSNFAFTLFDVGKYLEAAALYDEAAAQHPKQYETFKKNADVSREKLMSTISLRNYPVKEVETAIQSSAAVDSPAYAADL